MKRMPLPIGSTIQAQGGSSYTYIIDRVIGDGASGIVYEAHYIDNAYGRHDVRLKECYPYASDIQRNGAELVWADAATATSDKVAFTTAYHKLLDFQNTTKLRNSTAHIFDLCEANGTLYSVMDVNEGKPFEDDGSENLSDILKTTLALARVVEKYHDNGYLHLDIKPSNFLVIPETRELVILFDVDSVTPMDDIRDKKIKCVSYSKGWAAPEQMQGRIDKLCPATDIYSVGAILFQKVMGRAVENEDIGVFADWDFDGKLFDDVNPAIKRLLREIFKNTLAANVKRRYQTANELIGALDEARKVAEQDVYLVNEDVFSEITFVGREKDLANMHDLFSNGTKAIFLHGFGGVGKTALARRFAELYAAKYDCVQFHRYTKGLATIIDDHMVNVDSDDQNSHRKQLKKICDNTKALILIDNFDVEDDEDLEYLLSLNVNLIFTTRNDYIQYISSEKIEIVELESLPTEDLMVVFKNEYEKPLSEFEEELVEELIEKFGNLTILIPIIAKQIIASKISVEDFANSVENDAFARFGEQSEDIRIRKDGKSQRTNSLDFIRAMFNIAGLSDKHKLVLRYLDLLKYHNCLTIKEYRRLTGEKNLNTLNDLQFRNWVSFVEAENNEDTKIKVHQLIYDLVEKDDKPTYQNVPGIASYIEKCFDVLDEIIHEESNNDELSVDFEKASCITYALLIYDDIRLSEEEGSRCQKTDILYGFMSAAFLVDPKKTYKLFFGSSKESTYYFYVNGIMDDWFDFLQKTINQADDWVSNGQIKVKENKLEFPNGCYVELNDDESIREFIENDKLITSIATLSAIFDHFPFYTMSVYFYNTADCTETANRFISLLTNVISGTIIDIELYKSSKKQNVIIGADYLCKIVESPKYNFSLEKKSTFGVSVKSNYEFYCSLFDFLKKVLQLDLKKEKYEYFYAKEEEILILLEQANERFAFYGLDENSILSYVPPSVEEYGEIASLHWRKKADVWYNSVDKFLFEAKDLFDAYKLLLTFDYQKEFVSNSKIKKLLEAGFIDNLYGDSRLSLEEKKELLITYAVKEISNHLRIKGNLKARSRTVSQLQPKAELYYQAISKIDLMDPQWKNRPIGSAECLIVDATISLRRLLGREFFDIYEYTSSQISMDNIDHIGDLLYLADKLRIVGFIKKSKGLKNKILDLCLETNLTELSEATIQMILYKIRPLAINYKREDVVSQIDTLPVTIERKYCLELLDTQSCALALKHYEHEKIATKFMDDYIDMVALEAYEGMHGTVNTNKEIIDEMERLMAQNLEELLRATDKRNSHYRNIFYYIDDKRSHRSLDPYWAREFHGTGNKEVNIGLCYLIAQYCDVPAVDESLDYLTEEDSYELTREELDIILKNIEKICSKFKK